MSIVDPFDHTDVIRADDMARLAATLDVPTPQGVPPLWHWTSFLDRSATQTLGSEGHPRQGGLIAEPPYSRRMFAGGRMHWTASIPLETPVRRTASVGDISHKDGSHGPLAFVTITLKYAVDGQILAVEEQDIVYLPDTTRPSKAATPLESDASEGQHEPSADLYAEETFHETTLFRFSALTFNTHRIHYDLPYTRDIEGYPGLVVHGPMLIMRCLDLVRVAHGEDSVKSLAYRMMSPAFCGSTIAFVGRRASAEIALEARYGGRPLVKASVTLASGPD